jgi:DNA-directed RNA polymerase subunit RPC12/RpoP
MVNTVYVCRSCGYVFAQELSELIENNVQVYCEMCGTPFSLAGVEFKNAPVKVSQPNGSSNQAYIRKTQGKTKFANAIKIINKFDAIPLIILAVFIIIFLSTAFLLSGWSMRYYIGQICLLFAVILILVYNFKYISPRIKSDGFNSIALDAFCYGILGCIMYGLGVIILIKGILILIYNMVYPDVPKNKLYYFGERLKNSLNNFSAKAGFVIISLVLYALFTGLFMNNVTSMVWNIFDNIITETNIWSSIADNAIIIIGFSLFPGIVLLIDYRFQRKIYDTADLNVGHAIGIFILGIIGTSLINSGIFILLKGILLFFLTVAKPLEYDKMGKPQVAQKTITPPSPQKIEQKELKEEIEQVPPISKKVEEITEEKDIPIEPTPKLNIAADQQDQDASKSEEEPLYEEEIKSVDTDKKEAATKIEESYEPRLHESLLPVKSQKDREVVIHYFSKIFNVLSKDLRAKVKELDIPKKERKELLKELAFLTEQEQERYIEMLKEVYKEFPKMLIERVRKLKNVQPEHFKKIIEQLKYMDSAEQLEFVQFLEKNA